MATQQEDASNEGNSVENTQKTTDNTDDSKDNVNQFYNEQVLSAEQADDEITNNDGSVKETLDTAFHDEPGYISEHSLAGSNRADYYEARSQGKSDVDEELDYLKKQSEE
jgi:hypothetical protein